MTKNRAVWIQKLSARRFDVAAAKNRSAAERREKVAHGVSRGFDRQINQAAERRKKMASFFCRSCRSFFIFHFEPIARAMGYYQTLLRSFRSAKLRREFFAVRQMVAVPAAQGFVAGVFKQKLQRRRFDVAVAKDHVGVANLYKKNQLSKS
jgi:hypothetical protein